MFVNKNYGLKGVLKFTGAHIIWMTTWALLVASLYHFLPLEWLAIPWLPLSVIGTAVAFYVGFKNNSSYDRMWEARKIWGAIVNSSRMWGTTVRGFVTNHFATEPVPEDELRAIHHRLFYRHIAWLYTLRSQLLIPTSWEHISQNRHIRRLTEKRAKTFGVGLFDDDVAEVQLSKYLGQKEMEEVIDFQNTATQIIDRQTQDLRELHENKLIDDLRHMELQNILNDFYTHQGKCERIKKFPLPRQYGASSLIFVGIFVFLLPFGMIPEFMKLGPYGTWLSVPFIILVSRVYVMMELIGDYSENPFEGLGNDIPMLALCRTIEIDLREMLGEIDIPPKIQAVNGVLM